MAKYIDRDLALSFPFGRGEYDHKNANPHFIFGCETYKEWIEGLPTADVAEVRHGHWIEWDDGEGDTFECSACGETWTLNAGNPEENNMHYCPNCGAVMDKKEADAE